MPKSTRTLAQEGRGCQPQLGFKGGETEVLQGSVELASLPHMLDSSHYHQPTVISWGGYIAKLSSKVYGDSSGADILQFSERCCNLKIIKAM